MYQEIEIKYEKGYLHKKIMHPDRIPNNFLKGLD